MFFVIKMRDVFPPPHPTVLENPTCREILPHGLLSFILLNWLNCPFNVIDLGQLSNYSRGNNNPLACYLLWLFVVGAMGGVTATNHKEWDNIWS